MKILNKIGASNNKISSFFREGKRKGYLFSFMSSILEAFPSIFPILIISSATYANRDDFKITYVLVQHLMEFIIITLYLFIKYKSWCKNSFFTREAFYNFLAGAFVGLGYSFYYFGLAETGPILSSIVLLFFPILTTISSQLLLKNKISKMQYLFISIFAVSLALMYTFKGLNGENNDKFIGSLLILIAVILWTTQSLFLQISLKDNKLPIPVALFMRKLAAIPSHIILFMIPYSLFFSDASFFDLFSNTTDIFSDQIVFWYVFAFAFTRFFNITFYYVAYKYIDADINVIIINTSFMYIPLLSYLILDDTSGLDLYYWIFAPIAFMSVILYLINSHNYNRNLKIRSQP